MRRRDTSDVLTSITAVACDAAAVFGGFLLATWLKFDSGLLPVTKGRPDDVYAMYALGAAFGTLLFLLVFRSLDLYVRPQIGSFPNKIPRLAKGVGAGVVLTAGLGFAIKTEPPYSAHVVALSLGTILFFVLLERYVLYRIEWNLARHSRTRTRVLIAGTDAVAAHLARTFAREPMLRSRVIGYLRLGDDPPDPAIPADLLHGTLDDLERVVGDECVDQVILTSSALPAERVMDLVLLCDRHLVTFNMVPDLFRIITGSMDVQSLDDIPLLGLRPWPLDRFWNRAVKRAADIAGAALGLLVTAPVIAAAAAAVKVSSPGPVFYAQERCGEGGRRFRLFKLRTMRADAEAETGPVFTAADDPRRTRVGAFLRRYNLDELPQLWNVLAGDMSLVGPRPERPHFVEKFRDDIARYMWRHVSKPGLTGWAQVNGLRGNTSIEERIRYDLYYLENWSLAFDFKILMSTLRARENAY